MVVEPDLRAALGTRASREVFAVQATDQASSREHGEKVIKARVVVLVGDGAGDKLTGTSVRLGGGGRLLSHWIFIAVDAVRSREVAEHELERVRWLIHRRSNRGRHQRGLPWLSPDTVHIGGRQRAGRSRDLTGRCCRRSHCWHRRSCRCHRCWAKPLWVQ